MENYSNFAIKVGKGKYTKLDKDYKALLDRVLEDYNDDKKERWELYNIIITELIEIGREDLFQAIKYKLTDGENPNKVMLEIINELEPENFLWLLKRRIDEFLEEDFFNKFFL